MEKQISFSGVDLTPYSDISPDGQCSVLHNVELHNGALRPSLLTGEEYTIDSSHTDCRLVHVHATSAFRHLIFLDSYNTIYWADEDTPGSFTRLTTYSGTNVIKSVGNTLIALSDSGVQYYLWSNGGYKYIGSKLPEIGIRFGLEGAELKYRTSISEIFDYSYEDGGSSNRDSLTVDISGRETSDDITSVVVSRNPTFSDYLWAGVNQMIRFCEKKNFFYAPFFVRFAYKLYDGTVTMASHPMLMVPCSSYPLFYLTVASYKHPKVTINPSIECPYAFTLCLHVDKDNSIENWKDIVTSIGIYVTPQTPNWEYGSLLSQADVGGVEGWGIFARYYRTSTIGWSFTLDSPAESSFEKINYSDLDDLDPNKTRFFIKFAPLPDETYKESLISNMQFYEVAEYKIDELINLANEGGYKGVKFNGSKLNNLVQQTLLDENYDYQSHDIIIPSKAYVYNSRLHVYDISKKLFNGFEYAYTNPIVWSDTKMTVTMYVHINADDGEERVVKTTSYVNTSFKGLFFYYPNQRAYKITVVFDGTYYELPLSNHPFLNGSYYLDWSEFSASIADNYISVNNDPVSELNKLYVSDADNPYVFPADGAYTVGSGQILGIATVATPLSTGQLGQFHLIFFCSDGNVAYKVSDEGKYLAPTDVQRDVCTAPSSITVLDSEVLYLSEKGAMMTQGSAATCINRQLDGVPDTLPSGLASSWSIPDTTITSLLRTSSIAYDYANARIIFFIRGGNGNALIYSISDQSWSSAKFSTVRTVLNIYPYSYVQLESYGKIIKLANSYTYGSGQSINGLILTRPLKLDSYVLKRIHQFSLQGTGSAATIWLYASQDGSTWFLLGKTTALCRRHIVGRSFKYFRFAVETNMSPSDNISGLRLEYEMSKSGRYR
jgi:hypothetical protein